MIGRLNHVAIAVTDLAAASRVYRDTLGAELSAPLPQPEHGVTVVFITLPNTKIELLEPLGEGSPIAGFLDRNPERRHPPRLLRGRRHRRRPRPAGRGGRPRAGRRPSRRSAPTASRCIFLHPKDFCGTLVELEQA